MKKFILIIAIFSATVFVSYKYSARVHIYYLKLYYEKMYTEGELYSKALQMYDQKRYEELKDYINPLIIIYPDNNNFKKIAAFNFLRLGNALEGAELLAGIPVNSLEESRTLEEVLKNLYSGKLYGDLLYFYDKGIMHNNVNTAFYYGVSLYHKGRYDESYKLLIYVKSNTFMLPELSYYLGLNLDKKGKLQESLTYIKSAYESDRFNKIYKKALVDSYRKSGFFKDAEVLLRGK